MDLLTTGIDVPEITNLVFLRRVKSRILFEQMLGRATRLFARKFTRHTLRFTIRLVSMSLWTRSIPMKPVAVNPSVSFGQLLDGLEAQKEETQIAFQIDQIIAKLQRRKRNLDSNTMEHLRQYVGRNGPHAADPAA